MAEANDTVIGLKKNYENGVDEFSGNGHTGVTLQADNASGLLDFSNTHLTDIKQVNAGGGNDTVVASDLDVADYSGQGGNDTMTAGAVDATFHYSGSLAANGYDSFVNGGGTSMAVADANDTVIGLKKNYDNGVDEFSGNGHTGVTLQADNASGLLDFSNTHLTDIAEIDANGGNDDVTTAQTANMSGPVLYDGGSGNDTLRITLSVSQIGNAAVQAQLVAYDAASHATPFTFTTLGNFQAVNFEHLETALAIDGVVIPLDNCNYENVIVGTNYGEVLNGTSLNDLIIGLGGNDTINGGDGSDCIIAGSGDDTVDGGEGSDHFFVIGTGQGFDTYNDTGVVGYDKAIAAADGTAIGVNAYNNGIDEFTAGGNASGGSRQRLRPHAGLLEHRADRHRRGRRRRRQRHHHHVRTLRRHQLSRRHRRRHVPHRHQDVTLLYDGTNEGYDSFATNGSGNSVAVAESDGTVIGVNGYSNGIDEFSSGGNANVVVRDNAYGHTLDFSNTALTDIAEVDAGGGNDTITTSELSDDINYRGGTGDDTFHTGTKDVTLLYDGTNEGYDSFATNGAGNSVAVAESDGTVIGVNGYSNGIDEFSSGGNANVVVRDNAYGHTLDFSNTALTDIAEVDAGGGNDTITTSELSDDINYRGGTGDDTFHTGTQDVTLLYDGTNEGYDSFATNGAGNSVAVAESDGTVIGVNGYSNGIDEFSSGGNANVVVRDNAYGHTLDFSNTALTGIAEVDAGGGNDTITTSELSDDINYRGGTGDDTFHTGTQDVTLLYDGTNKGYDSFATNGAATAWRWPRATAR